MARKYEHIKKIASEIFEMKAKGYTKREIAEYFGLSKEQVKNLINRHNRAEREKKLGILPKRKGRPPKGYVPTEQEKDNEIKRLKMENDLLRDFLRLAGRR